MTPPVSDNSLLSAVTWVERLLTGPVATACAVLAIAGLGYRMLAGRIELRRAGLVVLGIFILFGAPTIVRELTANLRGDGVAAPDQIAGTPPPPAPTLQTERRDPYAGASIPE